MVACTTETKPQGRDGQTIRTNVHKANLGSQLSIFDTGSFARAPPRPNNPPERVDMDALKRPARMILHGRPHDRNEGTRESRANELHECAQTNLRSQLSIFDTGLFARAHPHPNDSLERVETDTLKRPT